MRIIKGGNELATFLSTHYKQNFSLGYCIIAFAIPMLFLSIGKLIIYFVMPSSSGLKLPTIKKGLIILWALIAEELGWRGYLQEQIERRIGSSLTPLVVGLIWALWHFHFWMIDGIDVPITVFTYGAIAESYGYYMITKLSKGNICLLLFGILQAIFSLICI